MTAKLVIWGAGAHARVVADIVRLGGAYELVGFLDDVNPERHGTAIGDLPILGGREALASLHADGVEHLVLGFGDGRARLRLAPLVREHGFQLATLIHPRAIVGAGVPIGAGTVIKGGAVIDVDVRIGANVIVSAAWIAHGSVLEDGVLISVGVALAGRTCVGKGSRIGAGATLRDGVRVGAGCLIGAGAVVLHDIPDGMVAYGVPARPVRSVRPSDQL